jgi:hypothetical protein
VSQPAIDSACRPGAVLRRRAPAAVLLAAALGLAACATPTKPVPKYVSPTSGPTAKLVMRGNVPQGDLFGVFVYDDSEKCTGSRLAGTGNNARNPVSTTLAASQVTTVEFYLLKPNRQYCNVRWSFTPVAGKTYLLSGAALTANACGARVMDMSNPESIKVEPTALRRNPGASACLPLAQSRAATVAGSDAGQSAPEAVLRQGAGTEDLQGLIGQ